MKYFALVWSNLKRKKVRTIFTLLSILVAFLLFGFLSTINQAFSMGVDVAGADRLLVVHKVSIIQPLPIAYKGRIAAVPGVKDVTHLNWFGGYYQDPKNNQFGQMAVEPESFLRLYPEFVMAEEQKKAWLADRAGMIVGRVTAERFGWKVGDKVPLQATIYPKTDGSTLWELNVSGIYDGRTKSTDTSGLYFHYDYLNEGRGGNLGFVGWYAIRIADPKRAAEIAGRVDSLFANSPAETKTETEKAFVEGFANQVGNIGMIIRSVVGVTFFVILLVAGNTMAQSVRERTSELAVLKTLGFSNGQVVGLVLAESLLIAVLGGLVGLGLAWVLITAMGDPTKGFLPVFFLPGRDVALGALLAVALGVATGLPPAVQAMRLRIVDALRRV